MTIFNADIVVPLVKIYLHVHVTSLQLVDQLQYQEQQIVVAYCSLVQISVVGYHLLTTILLGDKEYRRGLRRLEGLYESLD